MRISQIAKGLYQALVGSNHQPIMAGENRKTAKTNNNISLWEYIGVPNVAKFQEADVTGGNKLGQGLCWAGSVAICDRVRGVQYWS